MRKEIYVISGINGQLGRCIAQKLRAKGKAVRGLVLTGDSALPISGTEIITGDICDEKSLEPLFEKTADEDILFIHSAGLISITTGNSELIRKVNVDGTRNIVRLCEKHRVRKLIYISSVHAFSGEGRIDESFPISAELAVGDYAKSKAEATNIVLAAAERGLDASVLFPSGMIGPGGNGSGQMDMLIESYAAMNIPVSVKGGYDFADIRDVADAVISSCCKAGRGEKYILSGHYAEIREISNEVRRLFGRKPCIMSSPKWLSMLMAPGIEKLCRKLKKPVLMTPYSILTIFSNSDFSCEKAKKELGYSPRPLNITVSDTVRWLCHRDYLTKNTKPRRGLSSVT